MIVTCFKYSMQFSSPGSRSSGLRITLWLNVSGGSTFGSGNPSSILRFSFSAAIVRNDGNETFTNPNHLLFSHDLHLADSYSEIYLDPIWRRRPVCAPWLFQRLLCS